MKFWEAMRLLQAGTIVRAKCFDPGVEIENRNGKAMYTWGSGTCDIFEVFHEEWEIYENPMRKYKISELLNALRAGKKIKRLIWNSYHPYKYIQSQGYDTSFLIDEEHRSAPLSIEDLAANDWVEVDG